MHTVNTEATYYEHNIKMHTMIREATYYEDQLKMHTPRQYTSIGSNLRDTHPWVKKDSFFTLRSET
jgi:hypothetical protein